MPSVDTSKRPDPTDLADDDVRAVKDPDVREALYRMSEKIKACLIYQEELLTAIYEQLP